MPEQPDTPAAIIRAVADEWGIQPAEITAPGKTAPEADARHAASLLMREAGYTFREVGKAVNRAHSTTEYSVSAARQKERADAEYAERMDHLRSELDLHGDFVPEVGIREVICAAANEWDVDFDAVIESQSTQYTAPRYAAIYVAKELGHGRDALASEFGMAASSIDTAARRAKRQIGTSAEFTKRLNAVRKLMNTPVAA